MRIIGGSLKGRSIDYLKNNKTRPLKDNVKENIFNILSHSNLINIKIESSNILDLYSGVGSFGIESLSRGAKKVTFVEQDYNAIEILKKNLSNLSIINKTKIHNDKIENILNQDMKEKFQIFFLDPPFSVSQFLQNLVIIKDKRIYNNDHIVIIHREIKSEDELSNILKIIEIKKYGRSKIIFGVFK
jgi:16S rRNA (guanine966-N2)-methyltransferase